MGAAAGMNEITLGAMPPSPNGRHRAWRKLFRRWWPGDSGNAVPCGDPAPSFEGASPRKGGALRLGSRRQRPVPEANALSAPGAGPPEGTALLWALRPPVFPVIMVEAGQAGG